MSFAAASEYLDSLGIDAMKSLAPSLDRIEALLELLGHPEQQLQALHITGTNGKSSVARIATALMVESGLTVGTFTSPHLQTVRERIAFGGEPISENEFGAVFAHIRPFLTEVERTTGEKPSYFETLVGMFFLWAADRPVDVCVVEVGLGGRWDATNVVRSPVVVITNVSLDHTAMLGKDRLTIAKEKAGIIKDGATAVTGERSPDVQQVIGEEADGAKAEVVTIDRDFGVIEDRLAVDGRFLSIRTRAREYEEMFLPLQGMHQATNAAVALEAVTSFFPEETIEDDIVMNGLARVSAPGRMERIAGVMLDVAHNPSAMAALISSIQETYAPDRAVFVVGFLDDKDYRGMLLELARLQCDLVAVRAPSPRSVEPTAIATAAAELDVHCTVEPDIATAVAGVVGDVEETFVCVTGSHYVVGEARDFLLRSLA